MPLAAIVPLIAVLLGLWAGGVALGFAKAPGWEPFRNAAWPAFCASVYCLFDLVIAYPTLGKYAPLFAPLQVLACGGFLASLSWYLPAVTGPHPLDRVYRAWGLTLVGLGALSIIPGLAFARVATHRHLDWLASSYTEPYATPLGNVILGLEWLGLTVPLARSIGDARRGSATGKLHVVGLSLLVLTGTVDLACVLLHAPMPYFLSLGFIFVTVYGGRAIFVRFAAHAADLDVRSRSLTEIVEERTKELASAEEQLHRAEKLAALGQLAAGVAHEVNNPSAAVVANLSYVLETHERSGEFPPDAATALQESLTAMGRVSRIVRQLLDAGRAGARHEVLEAVDVARAVDGALAITRVLVPPNVRVRTELEPELSVRGREDVLVQALVNLITNAVQAIPAREGGLVTVSAKGEGRRVVLVVEDDGAGMSEEVRARIFEPFFTTKAPGVGTGLGLSVTLGIIRSLGGDVTVESQRGIGTRVSMNLRGDRPTDTSRAFIRSRSIAPAAQVRLMIIDDERAVREALRRVLKRTYEVRTAGGVDDGLEALRASPDVDVVLCDVLMPDGGGERVYQTLLARSPELARGLIFVTGGAPDATRAFLESQPQPVLEKPLDPTELAATIKRLLASRDAARASTPDAKP